MEKFIGQADAHFLALVVSLFLFFSNGQAHGATLFQDDFNDGNANGWTVVKDSGRSPSWSIANGGYQQFNDASGFTQSFHKGSFAYYDNGLNLTNYQLTVDITPSTLGSVGVMFRYKNNNNYYRFSFNRSQGFAQLERRVSGKFKTLAANGRGPAINQVHKVTVVVNGSNIFVYLDGEALFSATDSSLSSGSIALYTQGKVKFDNVAIDTISSTPRLIISNPVAYFVETSSSLAVAAIADQVPSGGGVRFTLDDQRTFTDLSKPYSGSFSNVPVGNHTISAVIIDGSKQPLADPAAGDTNAVVGAGGKYFIALGDSITQGVQDDITGDDQSADGRNASRGYTPILNDLLTGSLGRPITVINEGFGGTTSGKGTANGLTRVNSTKLRHPESKYWLIMFGTNDSRSSIPSGQGLQPGDSGYANSYKDYMQRIITSLKNSNQIPVLAKAPYIIGSPSRNALIQQYNLAIDELVTANSLPIAGPDFFSYFEDHQDQLADDRHPDGDGYKAMAQLWHDALLASGLF